MRNSLVCGTNYKQQLPEYVEDWPADAIELLRERKAILEFDGGLTPSQARSRAEADVRRIYSGCEAENLIKLQPAAKLIRAFRKVNNIGVKELAHKAKVHEQIIYRLQRGQTKGVSASAREKVAGVLGCEPADLAPT